MSWLYFDESIRNSGDFIVGALVMSNEDLSITVRDQWRAMGHDPNTFEYKSSTPKLNNLESQQQRAFLGGLLLSAKLGLVVCPCNERRSLGAHCARLLTQLQATGLLAAGNHEVFVDQNISIPKLEQQSLGVSGIALHVNQDSRLVAGLQLADHAAHALGGMLLEEMGVVRKTVLAGEGSGYAPDLEIDLGFELWAGLRYALIGKNEYIPGLSPPPDDPANPYFVVEGYGLLISSGCSDKLSEHARRRFGTNYLGCIH